MTEYSNQQVIFALNSMANLPSSKKDSIANLEDETKTILNKTFTDDIAISLIGKWQLVWGPKVYFSKGLRGKGQSDNAMYVAQNVSDPCQFVVAISGTNPNSLFDWIVEDATISPPVSWPYGKEGSNAGNITKGIGLGMNILLDKLEDNCRTLFKFLAHQVSNSQSPLSVTVTGHSLGGALSPVTALALLDSQGVSLDEANGWDPESKSKILVVPSAGPTPGDEVWRDYYDSKLGNNTDRIWNKKDIVPHAWQISMLEQIPGIYGDIVPSKSVQSFVKSAIKNSQNFESKGGNAPLVQILPSVEGLPGKVNTKFETFIKQAVYQHTTEYDELLCTTKFREIVNNNKEEVEAGGCKFCGCSQM